MIPAGIARLYGAAMQRRFLPALTVASLMSISACSSGEPAAAPAPTAQPVVTSAAAASSAPADPDGELACYTLSKAVGGGGSIDALIDQPGTVNEVVKAAADSTNPAIKEVGPALSERAARANALVDTDQAEATKEALRGTVERFKAACVAANLGYW